MSTKFFCDICGAEIGRNFIGNRISGRGYQEDGNRPVMVEIIAGIPPTWNNGHLCKTCLRAAVLDAIDSEVVGGR